MPDEKRYKILLGIVVVFLLLIAFIQVGGNKKFDTPYPEISASTDSAIIARGEYLVFGPAHCATCHVPMDVALGIFIETGIKMCNELGDFVYEHYYATNMDIPDKKEIEKIIKIVRE